MATEPVAQPKLLQDLLSQAIQRRPHLTALALVSPGGQLWAAVLPEGVEPESIAAMAAPAALLGRRIALEQLEGEMRQVYVEGEGGYVILRAVGREVILLAVAAAEANLALVLHDVLQIEEHVSSVVGVTPLGAEEWVAATPAIERLRQLTSEASGGGIPQERLINLRHKLDSLNLGYFPDRVAAIRGKLDRSWSNPDLGYIEEIEAELLTLERDVMVLVGPPLTATTPLPDGGPPAPLPARPNEPSPTAAESPAVPVGPHTGTGRERTRAGGSFIRRALRWLASIIASED